MPELLGSKDQKKAEFLMPVIWTHKVENYKKHDEKIRTELRNHLKMSQSTSKL